MRQVQNNYERSDEQVQTLPTPIIVTGYMHSGTTLVQQVLCRNDQVFCSFGETQLFVNLPMMQQRFPNLSDDVMLRECIIYILLVIRNEYSPANEFTANVALPQVIKPNGITTGDIDKLVALAKGILDHTSLVRTVYEYLTIKLNKTHWLDKSPEYIMMLRKIKAIHYQVKIVELVRDPRDILSSKLRRSKSKGNYDPILDSYSWRASIRAADSFRKNNPDNILRIRYEELTTQPLAVVARICDFVDISYDESMLDVNRINTSISGLKGAGIQPTSVGSWLNTLPPTDALISQIIAKHEMARLDCPPKKFPSKAYARITLSIGQSGLDLLRRIYRAGSRHGLAYLLNRLLQYGRRIKSLSAR